MGASLVNGSYGGSAYLANDIQRRGLSFTFNSTDSFSVEVQPGTIKRVEAYVRRYDDPDWPGPWLPIAIIHGKYPGPVLGLTAGVHGFEYSPILAAQWMIPNNNGGDYYNGSLVDPSELHGTIMIALLANPDSFYGRTPFVNPTDGKNLNREFPGNVSGTITEQMAHWMTNYFISRCDYFVDMHSGDAPEDLTAYSAYYHHEQKSAPAAANETLDDPSLERQDEIEMSRIGRAMALSMGFDYVIRFNAGGNSSDYDYLSPSNAALYTSAQAVKMGIPSVDVECGRLGLVEHDSINKIVSAIEKLICFLNMTSDASTCDGRASSKESVVIERRSFLESSEKGIFYPLHAAGDLVELGEIIGYTTDLFGNVIELFKSDSSGVILYMVGTPPVSIGETIACIGILDRDELIELRRRPPGKTAVIESVDRCWILLIIVCAFSTLVGLFCTVRFVRNRRKPFRRLEESEESGTREHDDDDRGEVGGQYTEELSPVILELQPTQRDFI